MSLQSINLYNLLAKKKLFKKKVNFSLKRIKEALIKLNNPEKKLNKVVNIIGSDGKYSVLTYLKFFIEADGLKASAFISPSIKSIKERFWIGDRFLTYYEIKKSISDIEKLKIPLTIFEVLTLIFILNASKQNNDFNLIEAGALFEKDSTNLFSFPFAQVVVNINKQHLNFLRRKTIDEIIKQKVGSLSQFTKLYIAEQKSHILRKIKKRLKNNLSYKIYSNSWRLKRLNKGLVYYDKKNRINVRTKNIHSEGLKKNLALAIKIALDIGIKPKVIERTIPKIKLQARVEFIDKGKLVKKLYKAEKIIIDGCHSEISGENFANYLRTINKTKYGIIGMSKNKDPFKFTKKFKGIFEKVIIVPIGPGSESINPNILKKALIFNGIKSESSKNLNEAFRKISSKESKLICVFGSLYLCGNFLNEN